MSASDVEPETEVAALQVVLNDSRKELEKVKMQCFMSIGCLISMSGPG
jgi:hypothetical protein